MKRLFPGSSGVLCSLVIGAGLFAFCRARKKFVSYNLGPGGDPRAYEPILSRYLRLSEFLITLATGSIVLIIGSSALHGQGGRLPWFFASPLILLSSSVVYGLVFMAVQLLTMEEVLHGNPHTAFGYALNETLGFSALICFLAGYVWLIIAATNLA